MAPGSAGHWLNCRLQRSAIGYGPHWSTSVQSFKEHGISPPAPAAAPPKPANAPPDPAVVPLLPPVSLPPAFFPPRPAWLPPGGDVSSSSHATIATGSATTHNI